MYYKFGRYEFAPMRGGGEVGGMGGCTLGGTGLARRFSLFLKTLYMLAATYYTALQVCKLCTPFGTPLKKPLKKIGIRCWTKCIIQDCPGAELYNTALHCSSAIRITQLRSLL